MAKYRVIRPWHGVAIGDVIETDRLHHAIRPNVEVVVGGVLTPATPSASSSTLVEVTSHGKQKRGAKTVKSEFDGVK